MGWACFWEGFGLPRLTTTNPVGTSPSAAFHGTTVLWLNSSFIARWLAFIRCTGTVRVSGLEYYPINVRFLPLDLLAHISRSARLIVSQPESPWATSVAPTETMTSTRLSPTSAPEFAAIVEIVEERFRGRDHISLRKAQNRGVERDAKLPRTRVIPVRLPSWTEACAFATLPRSG